MSTKNITLIGVLVVIVLSVIFLINWQNDGSSVLEDELAFQGEPGKENSEVIPVDAVMEDGTIMEEPSTDASAILEEGSADIFSHSGVMLGGTKETPLLDFVKSDYDRAILEGKKVVIFFYANWCPICIEEFPKMIDAFDELSVSGIVGFRVNYKDSETDDFEEGLAREFGVAYQHTKVFIKDGVRIGKFPDSWNKARYITEINNLFK